MDAIATATGKRGVTLSIYADECSENPRKESGSLGTLISGNKDFSGDEEATINEDTLNERVYNTLSWGDVLMVVPLRISSDRNGWGVDTNGDPVFPPDRFYRALEALSDKEDDGYDTFPDYGLDCDTNGLYVVQRKGFREWYGEKARFDRRRPKRILKVIEAELWTYNQWATGNVYGYALTDKNGENIDSCWGFYGDYWDKTNGVMESLPQKYRYLFEELK